MGVLQGTIKSRQDAPPSDVQTRSGDVTTRAHKIITGQNAYAQNSRDGKRTCSAFTVTTPAASARQPRRTATIYPLRALCFSWMAK